MNKKVTLAELDPVIAGQLEEGGSISFTVRGTSMSPTLSGGVDTVTIIKPVSPLKKYDVIFYRRKDGQYILHRIIKVKKGGYVCRGDNQTAREYPVYQDMVIGILKEYTHKGRTINADSPGQRIYSFFYVNTAYLRYYTRTLYHKIKGIYK